MKMVRYLSDDQIVEAGILEFATVLWCLIILL